jgi:hypothetical protein
MSFLFPSSSKPPAPPPPPPAANPPRLAQPSIMAAGAAEKTALQTLEGQGMSGTDVTGGQGAKAPSTTKTLLGQ